MLNHMKNNPFKEKAKKLSRKLELRRRGQSMMLGRAVKTRNITTDILNSEPELQAAFVEHVVDVYAKLGTPKGKKITEWFRRNNVPNASAEVVRLLLRRQLPFPDVMLAEMLEKLSRVSYLSLVEFTQQMAQAFERHAKKNGVSPRLRKAAGQYADAIAIRHFSPKEAEFWREECGFPRAQDRKIATLIDRVLGR